MRQATGDIEQTTVRGTYARRNRPRGFRLGTAAAQGAPHHQTRCNELGDIRARMSRRWTLYACPDTPVQVEL